jgi:hypothetical protein
MTDQGHRSCAVRLGCSPPRLANDSAGKRLADRLLPTGWGRWAFFATVAVGVSVAPHLAARPALGLSGFVTLAAGAWCLVNFWRCREAHCLVSGPGWVALALFEFVELGLGRSLIHGDESLAFVAVLVIALCCECAWRARHHSNVVMR